MLTWSFGWASSPASSAITSFAFMFEEVPEPVWKTSIGNWSSCSPVGDLVARLRDPLGEVGVELSELRVGAGGGGLDPPEPVDHRRRDRLTGDLEVLNRLRGLAAPELVAGLGLHLLSGYLAGLPGRRRSHGRRPARSSPGGFRRSRTEVRRRVDSPDQVGVDRIGALAHRSDQVAELDRRRPPRVPPGLVVELGRGDDHLLADVGELVRLLLGNEAVGDRRGAPEQDLRRSALEGLQVRLVADQAGGRSLVVLECCRSPRSAGSLRSAGRRRLARSTPRSYVRPPPAP